KCLVVCPVSRPVGPKEYPVAGPVHQRKYRERLSISESHLLLAVNAADIFPTELVSAALVDEVRANRQIVRDFPVRADRKLIGVTRLHTPIDSDLRAWIGN